MELRKKATSLKDWSPNGLLSYFTPSELYLGLSDRQKNILIIVCEHSPVDSQTLMKTTFKDRVTVLQSVAALTNKKLLEKHHLDPKNPKSRQIFRPTDMGLALGIAYLHISLEKHQKAYGQDSLRHFNDIVGNISESPIAMTFLANWLLKNEVFDDHGVIRIGDRNELSNEFASILFKYLLAENIVRSQVEDQVWKELSNAMLEARSDISKWLSLLRQKGLVT
jgi:predicted transcriptional regulator